MAEPIPIWYEEVDTELCGLPAIEAKSTLVQLASELMLETGASGVAIAIEDPRRDHAMLCIVSCGNGPPPGVRFDVNSGISGRCVRENRTLHSYDTLLDPRVNGEACQRLGVRSLAIAPMRRGSRCAGVLEVFAGVPGHFTTEVLKRIEAIAGIGAQMIQPPDHDTVAFRVPENGMPESDVPESEEQANESENAALIALDHPEDVQHVQETSVQDAGSVGTINPPTFLSASAPRRTGLRWALLCVITVLALFVAARLTHPSLPASRPPINAGSSGALAGAPSVAAPNAMLPPLQRSSIPEPIRADRSVRELIKRADSGDINAQVELANAYARGTGMSRDRAKAAAWYILAGAQGNEQAKKLAVDVTHGMRPFDISQIRFNVAKMYVNGIGTPHDLVAAYSWFALAKASGDVRAEAEQQRLEQRMSKDQIAEARERATEWLASHRPKRQRARNSAAVNPGAGQ